MAVDFRSCLAIIAAGWLALVAYTAPASAQQKSNFTKGQAQVAGGNGEFGTIYSIRDFNVEILGAHYSLGPYICNSPMMAKAGTKLLVLDLAVKNTSTSDRPFYFPGNLFTLIDATGQTYSETIAKLQLASAGTKDFSTTLHPGQGFGQPALHNPLTWGFQIPGNARIVKIMLNQGRLGRNEQLFRYYIAGATKDEAGEAGDPKNVITPLPLAARDPADPSGATLLDVAKGTLGTYLPSGYFMLRPDSFAYSTDAVYFGKTPAAGKKYAILTVTAKCDEDNRSGTFDLEGGDFPSWSLETADGDRIRPDGYRKATTDADPDHKFQPGDVYTIRIFWVLSKDVVAKRVIVAAGMSNKWGLDVSSIH